MLNKFIPSIVALTLFIQPLAPAFAQEAASGDSSSDSADAAAATTPTDTPEAPAEISPAPVPAEDGFLLPGAPGESQQSTAAASSDSAQADTGALSTSHDTVNAFDGSFVYDYPIAVPPGRNGLQPDLTLSYDSGAGSDHDLFGYGWSVDIPNIQRLNKYGSDKLYTGTSSFVSSLSGELVQIGTSNDYRAKVETGDFITYTLSNSVWTATDKSGRVYTFGSTAASRQDNSASSSQIYKWMVDDISDTNDNYIKFEYHKNQNQIYPNIITYTGHGTTDGIFEVHFTREAKTADHNSYFPAFEVTTADRIDRIEIQINDSWTRRYDLDYAAGNNTTRDVLATITESGRSEDGAQTTTLPSSNFAYQKTTRKTAVTPDTSFSDGIPGYFWDDTKPIYDQGYRVFEITCDALPELVHADGGPRSQALIYDNTGTEFVLGSSTFNSLVNFTDLDFRFGAVQAIDINGDACNDIVGSYKPHSGNVLQYVYLNNGDGTFTYSESYSNSLPGPFIEVTTSNDYIDHGYRWASANTDDLIDILHDSLDGTNQGEREVYINTGTEFVLSSIKTPAAEDLTFLDLIARPVDVNDDRCDDIVHSAKQGNLIWKAVYLCTGTGWVYDAERSNSIPTYFVDTNLTPSDLGYRIKDIMNDDYPEIVHKDEITFGGSDAWNGTTTWHFPSDAQFDLTDQTAFLIDLDGDVELDLIRSELDSGFGYQDVFFNEGPKADFLASTTNPYGGTITLTYKGSAELADANGNLNNPDLPFSLSVVTDVMYDNAFGSTWSESYDYEGGDYYFDANDLRDRKFAGFAKHTTINDLASTVRYFHQGNSNDSATHESGDSEARIGFNYRTEIEDLVGNLYQAVIRNFDDNSLGDDATFVAQKDIITADYDGDADYKASAVRFAFSNTTGNLDTLTEYGEVTVAGANFTDIGIDKRTTELSYASSPSSDVRAAISEKQLKNNNGDTIRHSKNYYDNLAHGSVGKGNHTKQDVWIDAGIWASTEWDLDVHGLVIKETDPRDNEIDFEHDVYNLYVATTTNAENLTTATANDYSSGQVTRTTEPNGTFFETELDPLDRPKVDRVPDPATGVAVDKDLYTYTDTRDAFAVQVEHKRNATDSHFSHTYLDGFASPIQHRTSAEAANQYVVRDRILGANGLLAKESLPYFSIGSARTTATTNNALYTEIGYDARERETAATTSVGTTLTAYDQWVETVTDPLENVMEYGKNAFGILASVIEHLDGNTHTTAYEHRADDLLTNLTDALDNEKNNTYDSRGLPTTLEDLHDPTDNTFAVWNREYDLAGNLVTSSDAKNQVVVHIADDANRPLTKNFTGASGIEVTNVYDTCTNGAGRLCSTANDDATVALTYDRAGNVATETVTIDGTDYITTTEYNRRGNPTLITFPDGSQLRYTYNDADKVEKVEYRESGGTFADLIGDMDYGPHGLPTYQLHANGVEQTRTYDPQELHRLINITTTASTTLGTGGSGEEHRQIEAMLSAQSDIVVTEAAQPVTETVTATTDLDEPETPDTTTDPELPVEAEAELLDEATEEPGLTDAVETVDTIVATTTPEADEPVAVSTTTITAPLLATSTASLEPTQDTETALSTASVIEADKLDVSPHPATTTNSELKKKDIKPHSGAAKHVLLKNPHEARLWQKFHEERTVGIAKARGASAEALKKAQYAKEHFDTFLQDEGFTREKGGPVKGSGGYVNLFDRAKNAIKQIFSALLPAQALAYLFDLEDFEDCSSLPCSLDSNASWGNVAPSLDSTGQVEGDDSLKEVVTGQGGGALESSGYNTDEIHAQFKVYIPSSMTWGPSGFHNILEFKDTSNNTIFWLSVEDWGTARLTMMGDALPWTNTGIDLTKGVVNTIELRFKKGATNGDVDIWVNNTTEASPDYDGSGTLNTGTDNVDDVWVGVTYAPDAIGTTYYDDIVIDSAFIGQVVTGGGNPELPFIEVLQDLSLKYDKPGNVIQTVDTSDTRSAATTTNVLDGRYRLISASTTGASTTPYAHNFSFNILGNPQTNSAVGTYLYEGNESSVSYALYDDSIASGWSDWSWWSTRNPSDTSPVHDGTYSLETAYTNAWGGLSYHTSSFDSSPYDDLELSVNVGSNTSVGLYLYFNDNAGNTLDIVSLEDYVSGGWSSNTWHEITIPLDDLDFENRTGSTTFHIESSQAVTVNYDAIRFIGDGAANYANPNAATNIGGVPQAYDNNGNLTSDGSRSLTWTYDDRLAEWSEGSTTVQFEYAPDDRRTKKTRGTSTTLYISGQYELHDGEPVKHIYIGEALVATIKDGIIYHNHLDHLGSTAVVTADGGYLNQLLAYYPFGANRIDDQYDDHDQANRFAGHDFDAETDLTNMGKRFYDPRAARFISSDPWEGDLRNPQSLNKYSFAFNNPTIFIDPDGSKAEQSFMLQLNSMHPTVRSMIYNEFETYKQASIDVGKTVAVGAAAVPVAGGVIGVARVAPTITAGAVTNAGYSFYVDVQDGRIDRPLNDYGADLVIGGVGARLTKGFSIVPFGAVTATESTFGQLTTGDHVVDPHETLVDTASAIVARGLNANLTPQSAATNNASNLSTLSQAINQLSVRIAAFEAFLRSHKKKNDDTN